MGGFFAALPWLLWGLLSGPSEPLARDIYKATEVGALNAAGTIGAAMLIVGVAVLVRRWRARVSVEAPSRVGRTADQPLG